MMIMMMIIFINSNLCRNIYIRIKIYISSPSQLIYLILQKKIKLHNNKTVNNQKLNTKIKQYIPQKLLLLLQKIFGKIYDFMF